MTEAKAGETRGKRRLDGQGKPPGASQGAGVTVRAENKRPAGHDGLQAAQYHQPPHVPRGQIHFGCIGARTGAGAALDAVGLDPLNFKLLKQAFRIVAPPAIQRTAFHENRGSDARAIMDCKAFNIKNGD